MTHNISIITYSEDVEVLNINWEEILALDCFDPIQFEYQASHVFSTSYIFCIVLLNLLYWKDTENWKSSSIESRYSEMIPH